METFIGFITPFPYTFVPRDWHLCDGALLPLSQNQALFALLGTTFGGDGRTTFGLPNLQGRTVVGFGTNAGNTYQLGQAAGNTSVTLLSSQVPAPTVRVANAAGTNPTPGNGAFLAATASDSGGGQATPFFNGTPTNTFNLGGVSAGGNAPVNIQNPYLALRYSIALYGIFPSRS